MKAIKQSLAFLLMIGFIFYGFWVMIGGIGIDPGTPLFYFYLASIVLFFAMAPHFPKIFNWIIKHLQS